MNLPTIHAYNLIATVVITICMRSPSPLSPDPRGDTPATTQWIALRITFFGLLYPSWILFISGRIEIMKHRFTNALNLRRVYLGIH